MEARPAISNLTVCVQMEKQFREVPQNHNIQIWDRILSKFVTKSVLKRIYFPMLETLERMGNCIKSRRNMMFF